MNSTHTYVTMHVSKAVLDEITKRLKEVQYDHLLHEEGVTLEGVMLVHDTKTAQFEDLCDDVEDAIANCISNGHWEGKTDQLTDRELAEDLREKSSLGSIDLAPLIDAVGVVNARLRKEAATGKLHGHIQQKE